MPIRKPPKRIAARCRILKCTAARSRHPAIRFSSPRHRCARGRRWRPRRSWLDKRAGFGGRRRAGIQRVVLVWADVARAEDGVLDDNNVRGGFADLGSLVRDFALVPDVCVVVDSRILRSQTVMDRRGAIEKSSSTAMRSPTDGWAGLCAMMFPVLKTIISTEMDVVQEAHSSALRLTRRLALRKSRRPRKLLRNRCKSPVGFCDGHLDPPRCQTSVWPDS